jgi:hypothetical protein
VTIRGLLRISIESISPRFKTARVSLRVFRNREFRIGRTHAFRRKYEIYREFKDCRADTNENMNGQWIFATRTDGNGRQEQWRFKLFDVYIDYPFGQSFRFCNLLTTSHIADALLYASETLDIKMNDVIVVNV